MGNSSKDEDTIQEQMGKFYKSNFMLWPFSLILIIISLFYLKEIFSILALGVLVLMFMKSIRLLMLVNEYFKMIYELFGPQPYYKRNSLLASSVNIGLIGLGIYLFYQHKSLLFICPTIIISFCLFAGLGMGLSGHGKENENITG